MFFVGGGSSEHVLENVCVGVFFKELTPAPVFSCEFCRVFVGAFFTEHLQAMIAFVLLKYYSNNSTRVE